MNRGWLPVCVSCALRNLLRRLRGRVGRLLRRSGWRSKDEGGRCANCGLERHAAHHVIIGMACYDGEWVCSKECDNQLDALGCPLERSRKP